MEKEGNSNEYMVDNFYLLIWREREELGARNIIIHVSHGNTACWADFYAKNEGCMPIIDLSCGGNGSRDLRIML
jgi:hypothetical protein